MLKVIIDEKLSPEDGDDLYITMSGKLDEFALFHEITNTDKTNIFIDVSQISRINSAGVKCWMDLMVAYKKKKVTLQKCPPRFVDQINIIEAMAAKASIESVFLPYFCPECDEEMEKLVSYKDLAKGEIRSNLDSTFRCEDCDVNLQFLEDDSIFFHFIDRAHGKPQEEFTKD